MISTEFPKETRGCCRETSRKHGKETRQGARGHSRKAQLTTPPLQPTRARSLGLTKRVTPDEPGRERTSRGAGHTMQSLLRYEAKGGVSWGSCPKMRVVFAHAHFLLHITSSPSLQPPPRPAARTRATTAARSESAADEAAADEVEGPDEVLLAVGAGRRGRRGGALTDLLRPPSQQNGVSS